MSVQEVKINISVNSNEVLEAASLWRRQIEARHVLGDVSLDAEAKVKIYNPHGDAIKQANEMLDTGLLNADGIIMQVETVLDIVPDGTIVIFSTAIELGRSNMVTAECSLYIPVYFTNDDRLFADYHAGLEGVGYIGFSQPNEPYPIIDVLVLCLPRLKNHSF